jgi:hypothetical protein
MMFPTIIKLFILVLLVSCSTEERETIVYRDDTTRPGETIPGPKIKKPVDLIFFAGPSWKLVTIFEDIVAEEPTHILGGKTYRLSAIFERGSLVKMPIPINAQILKTITQSLIDEEHTAYIYYSGM